MSWITSLFGFLSSSKSKIMIGLACILLVFGIGYKTYQTGYDNGVQDIQVQVQQERDNWISKVNKIQNDYDQQTILIAQQHKDQVNNLNKQILKLKNNPKIIEKYIPVQMDGNIPETLVLLHNRAVNGSNLDQMIPDELIDKTSSCTLSDLSTTMTYNYTVCNQCYDRLNKLQIIIKKYIDKQKELK